MRLLFADAIPDRYVDQLRDRGDDCIVDGSLTAEDLPNHLAGVEVLVVRSTKVTTEALAAADKLGLIIRAGAGTDTIDCQGAADRGIYVCNVPGANAIAVAELTMGLLLSIDRNIPDNVADLRGGTWDKKRYQKATGLHGRTMGIVGLGDIGLAVAERARAFGLTVLAERKPGRRPSVEQRIRAAGIRLVDDRDDFLGQCDIVSIHVPGGASTRGLVDADFLAALPDGAVVLNTARGDVVDEDALLAAMDTRGFRAGVDVYQGEPKTGTGTFTSALAGHSRTVGTHHIGASTTQAQEATAEGVLEVAESYRRGAVINCVNLIHERYGHHSITVRHYDRVGVLAEALDVLREAKLNVNTMQNRIFAGSNAAVATIDVSGEVSIDLVERLEASDDVIRVVVTESP